MCSSEDFRTFAIEVGFGKIGVAHTSGPMVWPGPWARPRVAVKTKLYRISEVKRIQEWADQTSTRAGEVFVVPNFVSQALIEAQSVEEVQKLEVLEAIS